MKLKQYDMAIKDFEKAKSISPHLSGIHSNLGVAWYCKKEYEKAIENYSTELNRTPKESFLFFNRALCYTELDQNEKGLEDLSRALELKPDFHLARCFKGDLLMKLKRSGEAQKSYEEALVITHAKEKIKQLNLARSQAEKTIKERPESNRKPRKESEITVAKLKGSFTVQVGAFQNKEYAQKTKEKLIQNGYDSRILILKGAKGKTWYLVRVGLFSKPGETKELILSLQEKMRINNAIPRPAGAF